MQCPPPLNSIFFEYYCFFFSHWQPNNAARVRAPLHTNIPLIPTKFPRPNSPINGCRFFPWRPSSFASSQNHFPSIARLLGPTFASTHFHGCWKGRKWASLLRQRSARLAASICLCWLCPEEYNGHVSLSRGTKRAKPWGKHGHGRHYIKLMLINFCFFRVDFLNAAQDLTHVTSFPVIQIQNLK
jgi:hypothetical protein